MTDHGRQAGRLTFIAELHPQHGGELGVLLEMTRRCAMAGADVVKVQLYDEQFLGPDWRYLVLSREELEAFAALCDDLAVQWSASIFTRDRIEWCEDLGMEVYKIASRTVTEDPALCEEILDLGKPTYVSLGAWDRADVPFGERGDVTYLHCVSRYPTLAADLERRHFDFSGRVEGFSDHTLGTAAMELALARGATVLEKHVTFDQRAVRSTERGHAGSITPDQLAGWLPQARELARLVRSLEP
jgi:N,N'-diacetyllegionaminate synthase